MISVISPFLGSNVQKFGVDFEVTDDGRRFPVHIFCHKTEDAKTFVELPKTSKTHFGIEFNLYVTGLIMKERLQYYYVMSTT